MMQLAAVQGKEPLAASVQMARDAFEWSLHELLRPGAPPAAATVLEQVESQPGGGGVVKSNDEWQPPTFKINALEFWRLCTLRVTCALALGLPMDALRLEDALSVVRKVTEYFKAREADSMIIRFQLVLITLQP